jgi:uncharacterized protein (TIGR02284 family)
MTSTDTLRSLTETVFDSVEGYRLAIDKAESLELKDALRERLEKRQETLEAMNTELERQGGDIVTKGTMTGDLHRMWLGIADMFESGDEAAAERVEEGEEYLADKFVSVMEDDDLDPETRAVLEECFIEVEEGETFSDALEEQYD